MLTIGPAVSLFCAPASAHGTGYRLSDRRPLSLEFYYSTGETMSYLEAKVFSPKDEKFAFQSGRTDEDGRFAFTPNVSGEWRIVVKDEEGHLAEAKVQVPPDHETKEGEKNGEGELASVSLSNSSPEGLALGVRAAVGVSLLFNIAAFLLILRCQSLGKRGLKF
jgi:nickel transport protein